MKEVFVLTESQYEDYSGGGAAVLGVFESWEKARRRLAKAVAEYRKENCTKAGLYRLPKRPHREGDLWVWEMPEQPCVSWSFEIQKWMVE